MTSVYLKWEVGDINEPFWNKRLAATFDPFHLRWARLVDGEETLFILLNVHDN